MTNPLSSKTAATATATAAPASAKLPALLLLLPLAFAFALTLAPLARGLDVTANTAISSTDELGATLSQVNFVGNTGTIEVRGGANIVFDSGGATANRLAVTAGNSAAFMLDDGATLTFSTNHSGATAGGAIGVASGATLTLAAGNGAQYVFKDNTTSTQGAAIFGVSSTIIITNALFQSNTSTNPGGNNASILYNSGAGSLTQLNNVIFQDNASSGATGNGGAIGAATNNHLVINGALFTGNWGYNGGAIFAPTAVVDITSATFQGNYANGTQGGGAIFSNAAGLVLNLADVRFEGNLTKGSTGNGGGAAIDSNSAMTVTATNVMFVSNTTVGNGGAVTSGGNQSVLAFTSATFLGNVAQGALGGGAVFDSGNGFAFSATNSLFQGNYASGGAGGAIGTSQANNINLSLNNVLFASNTAASDGGAINITYNNTAGTATFTDVSFIDNVSLHGNGGAINSVGAVGTGANTTTLNYNVTASATLAGNTANGAASSIYFNNTSNNTNATVTIGSGATLNMFDPMGATVASGFTLAITQTGAGVWNLGGDNNLGSSSAGAVTFTVGSGTLNLIGAGKTVYKTTPVAAGKVNITTATGAFTLKTGAVLSAGGGNSITAPAITLEAGDTIALDMLGATTTTAGGPSILTLNVAAGGLSANGWAQNLNLLNVDSLGALAEGDTFNLITLSGATFTKANVNSLTLFGVPDSDLYHLQLDSTGAILELYYGTILVNNNVLSWTGAAGGNPANATSWNGDNWALASDATPATFTKGDIINLDAAALAAPATSATLNVDAANTTIAGMYASGGADYTITGNSITASATAGSFTGSAAATGQLILGAKASGDAGALDTTGAAAYDGTLTLANTANNFTGGIVINSGALTGNAQTLGAGTVGITIGSAGTLTFDQAAGGAYDAPISGQGALVKQNTGALTLTANNSSYAGVTTVAAGALLLAPATTTGSAGILPATTAALGGDIHVASGATFGGEGTAGSVTINAGATLQVGLTTQDSGLSSSTSTLTLTSNLNLSDGSIINYTSLANTLYVGGNFNLAGTSTLNLGTVTTGSFSILNVAGGLSGFNTGWFDVNYKGNLLNLGADYLLNVDTSGNILWLTMLTVPVGLNNVLTWTGKANDGQWLASVNWNTTGVDKAFVQGDIVNLTDADASPATPSAPVSITLDAPATVAAMYVSGTTSYAIAGAGGGITADATAGALANTPAATGKLILGKTAADEFTVTAAAFTGTLDLTGIAGANNFTGGVEINSGALRIATAAQLGATLANLQFTATTGGGALLVAGNATFDDGAYTGANRLIIAPNVSATIAAEAGATFTIAHSTESADTIASGSGLGGGAIYVDTNATLVLTGIAAGGNGGGFLFDSNTSATGRGGAIYVAGANAVALIDSATFTNNIAGTSQTNGGAISLADATGTLVVRDSVFKGNSTNPNVTTGAGGAIDNHGGCVTVINALFQDNTANNGGAFSNSGTSSIITSATFLNNSANGGANGGGAVYNNSGTTTITFTDVLFQGNSATTDTGGGGAYMTNAGNGISIFTNASFLGNTTTGTYGGAIYVNAANVVTLINVTDGATARFAGNTANGAPNSFFYNFGSASTGTLAIFTDAGSTLDMLDPIGTNLSAQGAAIAINKTGAGAWKLSGTSILSKQGNTTPVTFTVSEGSLYLYGANDPAVFDAATGKSYQPAAASIIFKNGNATANQNAAFTFTLAPNATLGIGGGNTIAFADTNANAKLTFAQGSILDFNLDNATPGGAPMLVISATGSAASATPLTLTTGNTLNSQLSFSYTNLITGSYNLLSTIGGAGGIAPLSDFTSLVTNATYDGLSYDALAASGYSVNAGVSNNTLWILFGEVILRDNGVITWTGAGDTSWRGANWTLNGSSASFTQGDIINLAGPSLATPSPDAAINVDVINTATIAGMYVSGTTNYTLTGATILATPAAGTLAGSAAATGKLILGARATDDAGAIDTTEAAAFTGTLTLANTANNFTGGIEINSGALAGSAAALGAGATGIAIAATGTLIFDQADDATYTAPINGEADGGTLIKEGAGALTLANTGAPAAAALAKSALAMPSAGPLAPAADAATAGSFAGTTEVNAGSLLLDNVTLGGPVQVATDATFGGNGAASDVTLAPGATLQVGLAAETPDSEPGTLDITGALSLGDGSILNYASPADTLNVAGPLTQAGASTINLATFQSGTFNLGNLGSLFDNLAITVAGATQSDEMRQHAYLQQNGADLTLTAIGDISRVLTWTAATSGTWALTGSNWNDGNTTKPTNVFGGGDHVVFTDAGAAAAPAVTIVPEGVTVSDMTVDAEANYTFTGGGITADAASVISGSVIGGPGAAAATGKLTKENTGVLTLSNADDNFKGGIDLEAGALAIANYTNAGGDSNIAAAATLQLASGTLNAASLQFAAGSTLTGADGALTGAATLNGQVNTAIAAGNTLTISAAIAGAGGFLKTGAGELQFNAAALSNTGATQIDEGAVRFTGYTATTSRLVSQTITLNGGNLTFGAGAGAGAVNEATANNWSGITLAQGDNAAASAISGANDIVYIGAGAFAPALQGGLIVAINAPDATTFLASATNTFTGFARVDSGTLQVTDAAQLGGGGGVKVALNGGALQISAPLALVPSLQLRASANTVSIDPDLTVTLGAITRNTTLTPNGATFVKAGEGTLIASGSMPATALLVAEGRYVATSGAAAPAANGPVTINAGAVFQLSATNTGVSSTPGWMGGQLVNITTAGTINNAFLGSGTLEITANNLAISSPQATVAHIAITGAATQVTITSPRAFGSASDITVDQSTIVLATDNGLNMGSVTLKNGATLGFLMSATTIAGVMVPVPVNLLAMKSATLASLNATGDAGSAPASLWFNAAPGLGIADHLTVTSPVTGSFAIGVIPYGAAPGIYSAALPLLTAPAGGAADFTIKTPAIDIGLYSYTVSATTTGGATSVVITGTGGMSNATGAINAMTAMLPMSWFSELDNVTQRMGELHFENRDTKGGPAAWMRGDAEQLNFNNKVNGTPFGERHYSGAAGVDYKVGDATHNVYLGAYLGYGQAQRDHATSGDATSDSTFGGIYATAASKAGWYLDAAGKFNTFQNSFTAIAPTGDRMNASYRNWAIGGSLELGKYCALNYDWYVQPMIQCAYTQVSGGAYTTDNGMNVSLAPGNTAFTRAGFMFGHTFETSKYGTLNIYVKGYYGRQWTTDGQIYVTTAAGQSARYAPVIEGNALEGGAGLSWLFTRSTQVYFDFGTTQADYFIKPWGLNLGIRHTW